MSHLDTRTPQALAYRKLYDTRRWRRLRSDKLVDTPWCERCKKGGHVVPATVVHHRTAHQGSVHLFFDYDNLESLCKPHHDGEAKAEEYNGYSRAIDQNGWPIDPRHPINTFDKTHKD